LDVVPNSKTGYSDTCTPAAAGSGMTGDELRPESSWYLFPVRCCTPGTAGVV